MFCAIPFIMCDSCPKDFGLLIAEFGIYNNFLLCCFAVLIEATVIAVN